ncbi:DUF2971 domain-containing protein [Asticcacaulis taihuensis]|uniref:DUF2971 domain-containing protein n=1 Tax=Asticcacaulis taihuensis TaxID=260084 RepID=UPI003F7CA57E
MAIVKNNSLWATEIRYFNDSSELSHTSALLSSLILQREKSEVLDQFRNWSLDRIQNGNLLFIGCFTENGNLLSQWRGYCPPGKGVSLGFAPNMIINSARIQKFEIGRCIYDIKQQINILTEILVAIENAAKDYNPESQKRKFHPSQSFHGLFEIFESDLLKIAALIKNPAFHEENEWRVISPIISNYVNSPIEYREGISTLVPYLNFRLSITDKISLERVYIGPTPKMNLSMHSFPKFLSINGASPREGTCNSSLPYTTW